MRLAGAALVLWLVQAAGAAAALTCPPDAVPVGPVCVDKYEASVWSVPDPTGGNAGLVARIKDGSVTLADLQAGGATLIAPAVLNGCLPFPFGDPPYPANFPKNGNWVSLPGADPPTPGVYAVSIPGVLPSTCLSWFQAEQACRLSDKRLPTNADWQAAASGTPDPAVDDESTTCNVGGPPLRPTLTGSRSGCVSNWGALDMVGNVSEWVAEWVPAATTCPGWGSFSDDMMCLSGAAEQWGPGAMFRGGSWSQASSPGVFAIRATPPPDHYGDRGGFRCAR
jgi:formylglycine-generating enzyme required for sulfatase activity